MKCPICNNEMQEGGLVAKGITLGCVLMNVFHKKIRLVYRGMRSIGKYNFLLNETQVPNAYFCEHCNKIVGIFDVTGSDDG